MSADRSKLASVEMINFDGLHTKVNPETMKITQLRECKNADFFREYGSMSKIKGTSRILNSQYTEDGDIKGIYWGQFYKTQDLSGEIDRQVLIGAGTTIRKIEQDGTTTELLAGEPDSLFRTSGQLDRFMYISSQDPFDVGKRGQMSKYDGTRITQWGLYEPGGQETILESFDDSSIFSVSNATASDSSSPTWAGASTKMIKGAASTSGYIEDLNRSTFAINTVIPDRAKMQVFIPRSEYRKLAFDGRAISVYIGSASTLTSNYYRFDFQIGRLFEGWNTLIFDFSTFPAGDFGTTVGVPDDDFLASIRFEVITNNAADELTVYWDSFVGLDQGSIIPEFGNPGGSIFIDSVNSLWQYRITFVDDAGFESNSGPGSVIADNTFGGVDYGSIELSDLPISTNGSVVKRNIYRTVASGAEYLFLGTINDNVTTTYSDTTPDTSLGTSTPPLLGDLIFDNGVPPSGGLALLWKRTAFVAGDPLNPTILTFSRFDLPEAFPLSNAIEFDERITGMFRTYLGVVVCTETSYWRIIGDNPDYTVDKVIEGFGCVGTRGVGTSREVGWAVDRDGMRLYDLRETIKISEVIRDRIDSFYKTTLEDTHTAHSRNNNSIFWLTKDSSGIYSEIYQYQYMIDEVRQGWFTQVIPNPATFNIQHIWEIEDNDGNFRFYCATTGGMVFELLDRNSHNWVDETGKVRPITMEILTPYMRLGATPDAYSLFGGSGRVVPRFIELRIKESSGAAHEWTLTVDTCDSASENATVRDTQDITFSFAAGQSILRLPTKDLVSGEYMRLRLINSELNKDLQIMGMKIYYYVRASQYMISGDQGAAGGQN